MGVSATGQRSVASGPAGEVAVVGGGWSGIATAWYLRTRGVGAVVIERGESLGGRSAPGDLDGREITFGGKNIGHRYSCFRAFTDEMGDPEYEYFGINSSRIEDGRLRTVDSKHRVRSILGVLRKTPPREAARLLAMSWRVRREQSNR